MATELKNLSDLGESKLPSGKNLRIGIVVAEWNTEITGALLEAAVETLRLNEVRKNNIIVSYVPGTFELTYGALMMNKFCSPDAIIVLGCVIQGETRHFDYICQSVSHGITQLNLDIATPVVFGVLTTNNIEQARDRAGGKHGNKGVEAAATALKMTNLKYISI